MVVVLRLLLDLGGFGGNVDMPHKQRDIAVTLDSSVRHGVTFQLAGVSQFMCSRIEQEGD